MRNIFHKFALFSLILGYITLGVVLFWLLYPYQVVKYNQLPIPVLNKVVKAGEAVELLHDFCKFSNVRLTADVSIEDGVIQTYPTLNNFTPKGCYQRVSRHFIPEFMKEGEKARIHYTLYYKVNPIRTIEYQLYSEQFTIL
jgi:hypothetical protein